MRGTVLNWSDAPADEREDLAGLVRRSPSQRTIDAPTRALPTDSLTSGTDGRQNHSCRALNAIQRTRQSLPVATIQMDIVA